jgi:hypothetical protein
MCSFHLTDETKNKSVRSKEDLTPQNKKTFAH